MEKLARYLSPQQAADELLRQAQAGGFVEYAQIRNLEFVFAPHDLVPLAPRVDAPLPRVVAFAVDMDGTSTTTEPLALHALEFMVRRITGRMSAAEWPGLDRDRDYPHVIGNSNFRHTEYLVERYRAAIRPHAFAAAFIEAVLWTLAHMRDGQRRRDVVQNARNCGLAGLFAHEAVQPLLAPGTESADARPADEWAQRITALVTAFAPAFRPEHLSAEVAAALDIYYHRYHAILRELERGAGAQFARELLGAGNRRLVEPMPGYEVFVPLVKGWLGPESGALAELLTAHLPAPMDVGLARRRLIRLAEIFSRQPAKLALVTASIAYETHACMREVIAVVREHVQDWPIAAPARARLTERLADYRAVFDGFVCASDAWEGRLKPHRDLYSLALFQMSVPKADYPLVVGLEDTEPGCIALRAAGVGCAVALPNHDTRGQDYAAAAAVVRGGLPELMLHHNLLLADDAGAAPGGG